MQPDWHSRKRTGDEMWASGPPPRSRSPTANSQSRYPPSDQDRGPKRRGRGKGMSYIGDVSYVPTTEHRIQVDMAAFPNDANVIMQLLGPRGRHQQRMKNESDSIVTTQGKGTKGALSPGEEPLSLVIRSKDPSIPLTARQVAVVHQIYDDIIHHVKEYARESPICVYGNSDNAASGPLNVQHIPPMSLMEFLWNLHVLLSRPRAQDLRVDDLFDSYVEMFNHDFPISSWLVVDPASGGVLGALKRIPHVVDLYQQTPSGPWLMRSKNPPDFAFVQLREVDDAYKIRLQQIAAGQIPLEDLADSSGITGMLFGLDKVTACNNILQGILRILIEKTRNSTVGLDLGALQLEFQELFKVPLDVYHLLSERSLLQFLVKFRGLFNLYNDGVGWKILLADGWDIASSNMENLVRVTILVQPKQRRVVRLSGMIPAPLQTPEMRLEEAAATTSTESTDASIAALVSMLQGFQKPREEAPAAPVAAPAVKKKTPEPAAASGTALNELMAALQAAKQK